MFCIRAAQPARLQAQFAPKRPQTSRAFRMAQPAQASLDYPLNFGAGTSFDQVVFGAVRPGGSKAAGPFQPEVVDEWAAAMKKEGITRVVSLLDESELTLYAKPLGDLYGKHFKRHDLITSIPDDTVGSTEAYSNIVAALRDAEAAGERVVIHCRGGEGRTGNAMAAWLIARHGLSPDEAEAEVVKHAGVVGAVRRAKGSKLVPFAESLPKK